MDLAFISTLRQLIFKLQQSWRPSCSPHNSAAKLEVTPIRLLNPITHCPFALLTKPPQPASLWSPMHAPSVFNFFQPCSGLSHRIHLVILWFPNLGVATQWRYSLAWYTISITKFGLLAFPLKMITFLLFQMFQIAKGKNHFPRKTHIMQLIIGSCNKWQPIYQVIVPKVKVRSINP